MEQYYLESSQIQVYPAGFRGQNFSQPKFTTEENLTHLQNFKFIEDGLYLDSSRVSDSSYYILKLSGYTFRFSASDFISLLNSFVDQATDFVEVKAYIRLRQVDTTNSTNNVVGKVLTNYNSDSSTVLDEEDNQGESYFYGLCFDLNPANSEVTHYASDLSIALGKIKKASTNTVNFFSYGFGRAKVYWGVASLDPAFTADQFQFSSGTTHKTIIDIIKALPDHSILYSQIMSTLNNSATLYTTLHPLYYKGESDPTSDIHFAGGLLEIIKLNTNRCVCRYTALDGNTEEDGCRTWFGESQQGTDISDIRWSGWREVVDTISPQTLNNKIIDAGTLS